MPDPEATSRFPILVLRLRSKFSIVNAARKPWASWPNVSELLRRGRPTTDEIPTATKTPERVPGPARSLRSPGSKDALHTADKCRPDRRVRP
jgi:hypothetical protein